MVRGDAAQSASSGYAMEQTWQGFRCGGQVLVADLGRWGARGQPVSAPCCARSCRPDGLAVALSASDAARQACKRGAKSNNEQVKLFRCKDETGQARLVYLVSWPRRQARNRAVPS